MKNTTNIKRRHKITVERLRALVEQNGWEFISCQYKNPNSLIYARCQNGHEFSSSYTSLRKIHNCPKCVKNRRLTYDLMKEATEQRGWKLLEERFEDSKQPKRIHCVCDKGHEIITSWVVISQNKPCYVCVDKKPHVPIPQEQREKIVELYKQGLSPHQISDMLGGVSRGGVAGIV